MRRPKKWTLNEAKQAVEDLCARSERWLLQEDVHKSLMHLSVSLGTICIYHELMFDALYLLRVAAYADARLYQTGGDHVKLWSGRVHMFADYATSLKYLREAQALLLAYERRGATPNPEIAFETNFLTFLVLWKAKKFREAFKYVQLCARSIRTLKHSDRTRLTLMGLVAMSLSACVIKIQGDASAARETLARSCLRLQSFDIVVRRLMERLYRRFGEVEIEVESGEMFEFSSELGSPDPALPGMPGTYFDGDEEIDTDFLVDAEFEKVFFVANFLCNVRERYSDPTTPLVAEEELEAARLHHQCIFHPEPRKSLRSRSVSVTDRGILRRNHSSSVDISNPASSRFPKRSPSCGLSAKAMLAQGRLQLKKNKANLKVLQKDALRRRKAKESLMLHFAPHSADRVTFEVA